MPLPVPLRLGQELMVSVPVRKMAVKVGVHVRLPELLVCVPLRKRAVEVGVPVRKMPVPTRGGLFCALG